MNPLDRHSAILSSIAYTSVGWTLAEINELLGCVAIVLGIAHQVWKWRGEYLKYKETGKE
jgi:hypothetical protein